MTDTPNSWTDGYGTVHAWPPPTGYWIASDDRWYAPELHPDYVVEPEPSASDPEPFQPEQTFASDVEPEPFASTTADEPEPATSHGTFESTPESSVEPGWFGSHAEPAPAIADPESIESSTPTWQLPDTDASPTGRDETSMPTGVENPATGAEGRTSDANDRAADDEIPTPPNRRVLTAVVGAVAVLGLIAGVYTLTASDDGSSSVIAGEAAATTTTSSLLDAAEETGAADPALGVVQPASSTQADLSDIESCTRLDASTLQIDMRNTTDRTASYLLTVAYLDADGVRVGDDNVYVSSLRAGERTIEQSYVFSDAGVGCEVIGADRYEASATERFADLTACTIREPNGYGYIEADLTVTNSGATPADYTIEVALIDAENVRRGYGTSFVENAAVGSPTPGEVYTTVAFDETLRCDVVAVARFDSNR
ncbi:MAG: FxLYD domain-containing protein [Acidimicrobiales bacterium]